MADLAWLKPDHYETSIIALSRLDRREVLAVARAVDPNCWRVGALTIGHMARRSRSLQVAATAIKEIALLRSLSTKEETDEE